MLQEGPYHGDRSTTLWPEHLPAPFTDWRIALRGERENLYLVDKRKIKRGLRYGPESFPRPLPRLARWLRRRGAGITQTARPRSLE